MVCGVDCGCRGAAAGPEAVGVVAAAADDAGESGAAGADCVAGRGWAAVKDIVERVGVSKPTVIGWKKRYAGEGVGGLEDRPKSGRRPMIDEVEVVLATLQPPPERLRVTHWSSRLLAGELGISHVWVGKIWKKWGCSPRVRRRSSSPPTPSWRRRSATSSGCT
jgi:transposase